MKNYIGVYLPLFIVLFSLFIGCHNPFEPSSQKIAGAEGTFTLEIDGLQRGRTILPTTVQSDFAAYTLVFSSIGKNDVSVDRTYATLGDPVTLVAATWNLAVTAYLDSGKTKPVAQGSLEGIAIIADDNTSRSLELKPIIEEGATGTFSWNIDFPTDVTVVSMLITPLNTQMGTPEQTLYFIGGTPDLDTIIDKDNSASPLSLDTGYYRVAFSLSNGQHNVGREEYLHIYQNMESRFEYTFTQDHFTLYSVTNGEDSGPGSLRHAIANAASNSTIFIEDGVGTIALTGMLEISKNLTIQGNGVTITRNASWTTVDYNSQLMYFGYSSIEVTISRVHFKDGRATNNGAAIYLSSGDLTLESCIFSGNQISGSYTSCGAIYNSGTLNINGCTFYNNGSAPANYGYGGAIYNYGTLTLTGNLFYGNTAYSGPVVYRSNGTVTSNGYNVVDIALGTGTAQSGWEADETDKQISSHPISPVSFRLLSGSNAANVMSDLPAGYPASDFYGEVISVPAAAGAVQSVVSGSGYVLDLSVNNIARGSVSVTPAPNADGLVSGTVTITATPADGCFWGYWLVDGTNDGSTNPLVFELTDHTRVQAVFGSVFIVDNFTDESGSVTVAGTLRHAIANASNGDIIRLSGVTPGTTTIALTSRLPNITRNITIEGNSVTITRDASWDTVDGSSQLMYISNGTVTISRVHFKNGRATDYGAAIYISSGGLTLESCIFSGNQTSSTSAWGGAIYNYGTLSIMSIKGCTFYNNSSGLAGGAIYNYQGTLTLTGNLFYGNTASANGGPVVYRNGGTVTSNGYNVADVALGTGTAQSGWEADETDKQISNHPISPVSFRLLSGSDAADIMSALPAGYPAFDFYGEAISVPAAAGAVQSTVNGSGYVLDLSVNDIARGSVNVTPAPNADGLVSGTVTITATVADGYVWRYWLVDGTNAGSANPLVFELTNHTRVQAVFGSVFIVDNFTDESGSATIEGTLRHALTNAQNSDIIRMSGVTPGTTTIALTSGLEISKSLTIQGNGVTITRDADTVDYNSPLMYLGYSSIEVTISRVHFKDGRATDRGAAITNNSSGILNIESCVFSGNQTSDIYAYTYGGAIYNYGTLNINGCTFYNNSSLAANYGSGGAIFNSNGTLTLTGNLFYGNTASANRGPVVYRSSGTVTSNGYNVVDVALGTGTAQSGWGADETDKQISYLSFSSETFQPYNGGETVGIIATLPAGYPTVDFYGDPISDAAAAGAVQSTTAIDPRPALSGTVSLKPQITVAMWGSYYGWAGNAALRININGTDLPSNARIAGSTGTYIFTVNPGDEVQFYWVNGGQNDRECAFAVYYSNDPPNPAFNPSTGTTGGKVWVSKRYNSPSGAVGDGTLMGSFTVPSGVSVGKKLTANTDNLGGSGIISYQWNRIETGGATTAIPDANSDTYTVQDADEGNTITVTVTRSNNSGSVTSPATDTVKATVYYTVTFNPNGGNWGGSTANKIVSVEEDTLLGKPDDPEKGGYISCLDGWYKEESLTNAWDWNFAETITTDITLYAKWRPYVIGETGPGGGKIFYRSEAGFTMTDDNSTAYYLEAASYYYGDRPWASSAFISTNITGLATGIGTGRKNTALILATDANAPAALACRGQGTGWFLPSREELISFANYKISIGEHVSLTTYSFWSSSQYDATRAIALLFATSAAIVNTNKSNNCYCWAIRAF